MGRICAVGDFKARNEEVKVVKITFEQIDMIADSRTCILMSL